MSSYDYRQGRFIQSIRRYILRLGGFWRRRHWLLRFVVCVYLGLCLTKCLVEVLSGPRYAKNDRIDLYANRIG